MPSLAMDWVGLKLSAIDCVSCPHLLLASREQLGLTPFETFFILALVSLRDERGQIVVTDKELSARLGFASNDGRQMRRLRSSLKRKKLLSFTLIFEYQKDPKRIYDATRYLHRTSYGLGPLLNKLIKIQDSNRP